MELWTDEEWRAAMSSADINNLPDSDFAYIEPGGTKDSDGKTTPRSLRHYPIHDAAHVRNALARAAAAINGGGDAAAIAKKAMPAINAAAKKMGIGDQKSDEGAEWRKSRAELLTPLSREVRHMPTSKLECRTADGMVTFRGLASSTDSPYEMGFYTETIKRGAFDKTLAKRPDVMLLANHEGLPLARTTNGSLQLSDMGSGLEFSATASADDPDVARIAAKVESGLMDQCSFAFRVVEQKWNDDHDQRDISEVSLDRGDVSIVNYGSNPNTAVSVRSLLEGWDDISPEEIEELREKLGLPTPIVTAVSTHNLTLYTSRAKASRLRPGSNSANRQ
jgi:HK97 family phage prohead protease